MSLQTEPAKIAHLLRRFGLGASEAELEFYGKNGLKGAIDLLLDYKQRPNDFDTSLDALRNPQNGNINIRAAQVHWYAQILCTNRPLEERMTMFWHHHFATSAAKVDVVPVMYTQIETLREKCLGTFPDLLDSMSKDQAMLYWLDNHENLKGRPNENFAREVMELFTLGIGNYTEKDVAEAARAFTGWTFGAGQAPRIRQTPKPARQTRFVFIPQNHDDGEKTVLGRRGNLNGDDVLGILYQDKQTSRYIAKKMWEWFAYENPEPMLVERLASTFRTSALSIKALVRAIMEAPEFYSVKAETGVIKDPVYFTASTARAMGVGQILLAQIKAQADSENPQRAFGAANAVSTASKAMGMDLLFPPDVAGWNIGQSWITTATIVERIKWADRLFSGQARPNAPGQNQGQALFALLQGDESPENAARRILSLLDTPKLEKKLPALTEAATLASRGKVNAQNSPGVFRAVARLVFASPEFQFA